MLNKFNFGENVIPRIHEEGVTIVTMTAIFSVIMLFFSKYMFLLSSLITLFCVYFFRDPVRFVPKHDDLVVSPADGVIVDWQENINPPMAGSQDEQNHEKYLKISIFLNLDNVHVNRIPLTGTITKTKYHKGKFINASLDKASDDNEKQTLEITRNNETFYVTQIAGLIARRIVCRVNENDSVQVGNRFGIIKFGSRVDIFLPMQYKNKVNVRLGQTMIGGETIICALQDELISAEGINFTKI